MGYRNSTGVGRYASNETDVVFYTTSEVNPALIVCHPHATNGLNTAFDPTMRDAWNELSKNYTVCVSDLGGPLTWGNSSTKTAINQIRTMLQSRYGVTGKVGLLGISMGGLAALNYAKALPSNVSFCALLAPGVNLNDLRFYNSSTDSNDGSTQGSFYNEIDQAYGGYVNSTMGPTYNPHMYRSSYPASSVRTGLWTTPNDSVVRNTWADNLVIAQPSIERYSIRNSTGSGYHHSQVVYPGLTGLEGSPYAFQGIVSWCVDRRSDLSF